MPNPPIPTPTPGPGMPMPQGDPSGEGFIKWLLEMMGYGIDKGTQFAQGNVPLPKIQSQFAGNETTALPMQAPTTGRRFQQGQYGDKFNAPPPSLFPQFEPGTVEKYGPSGYRDPQYKAPPKIRQNVPELSQLFNKPAPRPAAKQDPIFKKNLPQGF